MDVQTAEVFKTWLLTAWAAGSRQRRPSGITFEASLDAAEEAPPPPPGLAVGHVADETGGVRIGVRAALDGVRLKAARKLAGQLARGGVPVDFRAIPRPIIPQTNGPVGAPDAAGAGPGAHFAGHFRPLCLGSSVSHESGPSGTLGGFVRLPGGGIGVLSCSHVLAKAGEAKLGDHVYQPAQRDQPAIVAENRIATLTGKFAPLIAGRPNNLDAAIALLDHPDTAALGNRIPDIALCGPNAIRPDLRGRLVGPRQSVGALRRGTRVAKIGRSSGYTEGMLTLTDLTNFTPDIERNGVMGTYPFPGVIEITSLTANNPFARGGDSGALVFTLPELRPIGIHFCSVSLQDEPSLNYLMPLDRICDMLAAEMV